MQKHKYMKFDGYVPGEHGVVRGQIMIGPVPNFKIGLEEESDMVLTTGDLCHDGEEMFKVGVRVIKDGEDVATLYPTKFRPDTELTEHEKDMISRYVKDKNNKIVPVKKQLLGANGRALK